MSAEFKPFVPAEKRTREFTWRAVLLGVALGVVLCAANTYLGLKAGMTVSASIPAAVISMGILRGLLRTGTILENNVVQTIASAGESLAAGVIFTIPALVLTRAWHQFEYWPTALVALFGGVLGVLFMIPLRGTLIVEDPDLVYPEGVACAEVLEAGEEGGRSVGLVAAAVLLGMLMKFLEKGVALFQATVEWAGSAGRTLFYVGSDVSVALVAVGFIVRLPIAVLVFVGGGLAWFVGIPVYAALHGLPDPADPLGSAWTLWSTRIRFLGVGAMVVGGAWSIVRVWNGITRGFREALEGYRSSGAAGPRREVPRTEQNLSMTGIAFWGLLASLGTVALYVAITRSWKVGIPAGLVMLGSTFFFVAVSSYIVGLVGSSNNPVSGMTICTMLLASTVLLALGMEGAAGIVAVLIVAGVVCCAAATAGDCSQDLKTGYLVGATPRHQQVAQLLGVVLPAFVLPGILTVLHGGLEIGSKDLPAPQAGLFARIAQMMFGGEEMPWDLVGVGILLALLIVGADEVLRLRKAAFRLPVMPVAVGIYLPFSLSVPILLGGLTHWWLMSRVLRQGRPVESAEHRGVVFASGLIAGEALIGILLAFLIFRGYQLPFPLLEPGSPLIRWFSLGALAAMVASFACAVRGRDRS